MAIASSLFSPKSLMDRFRSPVFIASALSLGAHGVFFAAMPMLSASEDFQDKEESVPVVALSAEESQRLPDAVRNSGSSAFWDNDPFSPQEGESLLPVPGLPPYGDLTGLDSSFNDVLQAAAPPLWSNPIDIFQDSLPAIPGETSVIFPETNTFDTFGSQPFDIPLGSGANNTVVPSDQTPLLGNDPAIAVQEETDAAQDQPLLEGSNEVPGSGFNPPIVAQREGTNVNNAFGEESGSPAPVDPGNLASGPLGETTDPGQEAPVQDPRPMAGNDPALLALRAEQQRLRDGYRNNGRGAADGGQVAADLGRLGSEQSLALKPAQALVAQYPDPRFKCPADSLPALFTLVTQTGGNILPPELVQSTQYPALDTAAREAAETFAAELTEPGIYQLSVTFQDESGRCTNQDVLS